MNLKCSINGCGRQAQFILRINNLTFRIETMHLVCGRQRHKRFLDVQHRGGVTPITRTLLPLDSPEGQKMLGEYVALHLSGGNRIEVGR